MKVVKWILPFVALSLGGCASAIMGGRSPAQATPLSQTCGPLTHEIGTDVSAEVKGDKVVVHVFGVQRSFLAVDKVVKFGNFRDVKTQTSLETIHATGTPMAKWVGDTQLNLTFVFPASACHFAKEDPALFSCSMIKVGHYDSVPSEEKTEHELRAAAVYTKLVSYQEAIVPKMVEMHGTIVLEIDGAKEFNTAYLPAFSSSICENQP